MGAVIANQRPELSSPWEHEGLEALDPASVIVQLFSSPSLSPQTSWTVFRLGQSARVQRLQVPPGQRVVPRMAFGADSVVEADEFFRALDQLRSAKLPRPSDSVTLDGAIYGICDRESEALCDFWWRSHQEPSDLTRCFTNVCNVLDGALPGYSTLD
jgi:hypothetical protein